MSQRFSFEIKITGILLVVLTLVALTGVYAYQRFTGIVNQISETTRPDMRLITSKELANHINDAELSVKSYRITEDTMYLNTFYEAVEDIDETLIDLHLLSEDFSNPNNDLELNNLDSLINEKVIVLHDLLVLQDGFRTQKALDKVVQEIEQNNTSLLPLNKDFDTVETVEKKKLFDWLFKKKKEDSLNEEIIVEESIDNDSLVSLDQINAEVKQVKLEELIFEKEFRKKELEYNLKDQLLSKKIKDFLTKLEEVELTAISEETKQAEISISKTNRQIAIFCIITGLMILFMAFLIVNYIRNNNRYRRALKKSKNQAEDLAKTKQKFLANMSHEIRTPMNAIAGFSEQIGKGPLTDTQQEQLDMVKKSADHLLHLINEVLDLSKLQGEHLKLEKIGFNPKQLITDLSKFLKNETDAKSLTAHTDIQAGIPDTLIGDPFRLQQILFNLIGNAIKFTDSGSISVNAKTKMQGEEECILSIQIIDTGIGIEKKNLKKIFNEFEQAKLSTTRNYGGTGLGLSIVKLLVTLHEGEIEIESELNKGTSITINLPYKIGSAKNLPSIKKSNAFQTDLLKGLKILIVDDEKYNRLLLISVLKKYNTIYTQITNGADAIIEVEKNDYDLILMDIRMPKMDGVEATKVVRKMQDKNKNNIPIIALTAAVSAKDRANYERVGMNGFLAKPFKENELLEAITHVLNIESTQEITMEENTNNEEGTELNLTELKKMSGGDQVFYLDMLQTFIDGTQTGMDEIERCLVAEDWENMAEHAHKISSPCRHLGAKNLHGLLKLIENKCRENENLTDIQVLVGESKKLAQSVIQAIKKEIASFE